MIKHLNMLLLGLWCVWGILVFVNFVKMDKRFVVTFLTWNLACRSPNSVLLDEIALSISDKPDLFVICFQEIGLTSDACYNGIIGNYKGWENLIADKICNNYDLISTKACGGICSFSFLKKENQEMIIGVQNDVNYLKDGDVAANKATICTKFTIKTQHGQKVLSVLGNHLEAFDEKYIVRNQQFLRALSLTSGSDYIVMMGDLNYRIDMSYERSKDLSINHQYSEILERDQLRRAIQEHEEFSGFFEGNISFPPTYKYDEDSNEYDSSKKHRVPSYTDRILIKSIDKKNPMINWYKRLENQFSDHRPVLMQAFFFFGGD